MKRNLGALSLILILFLLLVGLNFLFMTEEQENKENELTGSRSSYRSTPYGTMAYYSLLEESGFAVTRLEKPFTALKDRADISTLVIIGLPPAGNPDEEEFAALNDWVESGKHLVIIDREIAIEMGDVKVQTGSQFGESAPRLLQPTRYGEEVTKLELSKYATRVKIEQGAGTYLIGDDKGAILADATVGSGRVVMLTDPFIVANNGIDKDDNVALAVNLFVNAPAGKIAFDEYHHGYGESGTEGSTLAYYNGTPVKWIYWQALLITALLVYSFGRRFARPLLLRRERRTTNLEFVSSMANITRLARASDLAMQNIYSDFHSKLCRYSGLPTRVEARRLAAVVARRMKGDEQELGRLLERCEGIAQGESVSESELLKLVTRIREIEREIRV
ncbi:MAG: DUF4350 domain-containing protein [Acidobacteriota bacterium]